MSDTASQPRQGTDIVGALKGAGLSALVALGLFSLLIGLRTEGGGAGLEVTARPGVLIATVVVVFGVSFLRELFFSGGRSALRMPAAVTETAGFSKLSGFVDDTRALCSIPARHDVARRVDAGVLAGLVAEHRLDEEEALRIIDELVGAQPTRVFKLGDVSG